MDLSRTEITEIMNCAFAHCQHLRTLKLPNKLRKIQQEAFLKCASLREVQVPPTLLYIARRAFAGCTQLQRFQRDGKRLTWRGTYSHANAFLKCTNLDTPKWVRWLPRNPQDEDQWADDSFAESSTKGCTEPHTGYTATEMPPCWHPCAGPTSARGHPC